MNSIERDALIRKKINTITEEMSDEHAVDNKVLFNLEKSHADDIERPEKEIKQIKIIVGGEQNESN